MRSAVVVAAVLLASAPARADHDDEAKIVAAINAKDAAQVATYVNYPVRVYDLWFEDARCQERFGDAKVEKADVAALVTCLAPLAIHDGGLFWTYEPGVQVQVDTMVVADAPVLTSIHGIRTVTEAPSVPQISASALESHRTGGIANVVLQKVGNAQAAVDVCIDAKGHASSVRLSGIEGNTYAGAVRNAAWKWTFKPFVVHGKAIEVCATELQHNFVVPAPQAVAPPPLLPLNVSPESLEALRRTGSRFVEPSDETKEVIADAKKKKVTGTFKLCIDDHGAVTSANVLKSTGFDDYDFTVEAAIQKWSYTPFLVNARAVPVCTAVTFIYTQR